MLRALAAGRASAEATIRAGGSPWVQSLEQVDVLPQRPALLRRRLLGEACKRRVQHLPRRAAQLRPASALAAISPSPTTFSLSRRTWPVRRCPASAAIGPPRRVERRAVRPRVRGHDGPRLRIASERRRVEDEDERGGAREQHDDAPRDVGGAERGLADVARQDCGEEEWSGGWWFFGNNLIRPPGQS